MALQARSARGASSSTPAAGSNVTFLAEGLLNRLQVSTVDKQGLQQDVDEFFGKVDQCTTTDEKLACLSEWRTEGRPRRGKSGGRLHTCTSAASWAPFAMLLEKMRAASKAENLAAYGYRDLHRSG